MWAASFLAGKPALVFFLSMGWVGVTEFYRSHTPQIENGMQS